MGSSYGGLGFKSRELLGIIRPLSDDGRENLTVRHGFLGRAAIENRYGAGR